MSRQSRLDALSPEQKRALLAQTLQEEVRAATRPPLSFAQQRLWFLDQFEPRQSAYHLALAWTLSGELDRLALVSSLNAIIQRHAILRTVFSAEDGEPFQVVQPVQPRDLLVDDLSELTAEAQALAVQDRMRSAFHQAFDLAAGPLWRAVLLRRSPEAHILIVVWHHAIFDDWSGEVFGRELVAHYTAYRTGEMPDVPTLSVQYADFAIWQRRHLTGGVLEAQLRYWTVQLEHALPVLDLPTDRPYPPVPSAAGARQQLQLTPKLTASLKTLSQREGVTLFMTLMAAFKALLFRYTGQTDLLVGTPVTGRTQLETESLIGFFINTLVLRTELGHGLRVRELLQRVRDVTLEAFAHQDMPFEKLVEALQPSRDLNRTPLFQVMFIYLKAPRPSENLPGLTIEPLPVERQTAMYDLTMFVQEDSEGLRVICEYRTDLFDPTTITRMLHHFEIVLGHFRTEAEQRLSEFSLLTASERQQILGDWYAGKRAVVPELCLHQAFEAQASQTPDRVALIDGAEHISYGMLNRQANQLAHTLRARGVGPEVRVGICLPRSVQLVVGILGILKAGGAYVPLDPSHPVARLAFLATDAQLSILLTQEAFLAGLPAEQVESLCLDTDWNTIAQQCDENPINRSTPLNLVCLLYTSGSTGQPKGVLGHHYAFMNVLSWLTHEFFMITAEVCCHKTSIGFVDAIPELFAPLLQGVPTVLIPDEALQDPEYLVESLAVYQVTRIVLVPSLLRLILELDVDLSQRLAELTTWFVSGERLTDDIAQHFREAMPNSRLVNLYGASETAADVTSTNLIWTGEGKPNITIGAPIDNSSVYVLDATLQPVPIGVPGELHVSGVGLSRGYADRPAQTACSFVPNPFSQERGDRLYKTGDQVRYLPDGQIDYLGRVDEQVKVRGIRIEPAEVEAGLERYPHIRQSVVMAQEGANGDTRLVAYLLMEGNVELEAHVLQRFLKALLPDYMIPSRYVVLDRLPLTATGKIDRRALLEVDQVPLSTDAVFIAPCTATEVTVANIWRQVLELERIGVGDNFFVLGGHSLLATRVMARLRIAFQLDLSLRRLFEVPTIRELAEYIETAQWAAQSAQSRHEEAGDDLEEGTL